MLLTDPAMFLLDQPYVSDFLKQTLRERALPVVDTPQARALAGENGLNLVSQAQAVAQVAAGARLYANSENALGWVAKHLAASPLSQQIALFKDKIKFRALTATLFPDFYYRAVRLADLQSIPFDDLPTPFIIKPAVGFMSMGVYKVASAQEWHQTLAAMTADIDKIKGLYPAEVLQTDTFIIEQCIDGDEFAVDAYFDAAGEPVVLAILNHPFSSDADVSDRVYISSKAIIDTNLAEFTDFIRQIGQLAGLKNFPLHIELRREPSGRLLPIEVNPLRFGGWCTTADLTWLAYGFNPYLYYADQHKPNWPELLKDKDGKQFCIIVLDNATGRPAAEIAGFDYDKLLTWFEKPLELRKIDFHQYPVFGFLFTETRDNAGAELQRILASNLTEFVL